MSVYTYRLSRHHSTLLIKADKFCSLRCFLVSLQGTNSCQFCHCRWHCCLMERWQEARKPPQGLRRGSPCPLSDRGGKKWRMAGTIAPSASTCFISRLGQHPPIFCHGWLKTQIHGNILQNISKMPQNWASNLTTWYQFYLEKTCHVVDAHTHSGFSEQQDPHLQSCPKETCYLCFSKTAQCRFQRAVHAYESNCSSAWFGPDTIKHLMEEATRTNANKFIHCFIFWTSDLIDPDMDAISHLCTFLFKTNQPTPCRPANTGGRWSKQASPL